ncbi:MAG: cell division protein ZapD [Alteromonadaceae bacterium]|jgi:cell division protein ZapD
MNLVIYEHPLNEKLRTFMRVEHLFGQVNSCKSLSEKSQTMAFFESLFALVDVLDRHDIRSELSKELEHNEQKLVKWSQHPQICNDALQVTLKKVIQLQHTLSKMGRISNQLKEEPFLGSIRQRFAIPGGSCNFDLPQLHFWTHLPAKTQVSQVNDWLTLLAPIEEAIDIILSFVRERSTFSSVKALGGFYQDNAEKIELLRIQYTPAYGAYPTVSGNKYRYSIRFMQLNEDHDRTATEQDILFSLARC